MEEKEELVELVEQADQVEVEQVKNKEMDQVMLEQLIRAEAEVEAEEFLQVYQEEQVVQV